MKKFFLSIDYPVLGRSITEVLWLAIIAFLPLFISISIKAIVLNNYSDAFDALATPGEFFAFSLSFIAPVFYFIVKTHGGGYKLPLFKTISIFMYVVYGVTLGVVIVAKNEFLKEITMKSKGNLFLTISLYALVVALLFRIYQTYHNQKFTDYSQARSNQQDNFNKGFVNRLNDNDE